MRPRRKSFQTGSANLPSRRESRAGGQSPSQSTCEIKHQPMEPSPLTCSPFCKVFRGGFFSHGLRKMRLGNFLSQSCHECGGRFFFPFLIHCRGSQGLPGSVRFTSQATRSQNAALPGGDTAGRTADGRNLFVCQLFYFHFSAFFLTDMGRFCRNSTTCALCICRPPL